MTIELKKTHAKEYLEDYRTKDIPAWLKLLIQKVLETSGELKDSIKNEIFDKLVEEYGLRERQDTNEEHENTTENDWEEELHTSTYNKLVLQKITHKKGVNALIEDQSIIFSPTCTVVYGLNGTGKSGYFRILNEIAGGEKIKDILGNIHTTSSNLEVDVDFSLDDNDQPTYEWRDKRERGTKPFNQIKVFDAGYLPMFLDERESSINVEPLGLNLFQVITEVIDGFKIKIKELEDKELSSLPDLQPLIENIHATDLSEVLAKQQLTKDDVENLKKYNSFSDEDLQKLEELRGQKKLLEKENSEDSKKVIYQEKIEIDNLNKYLTNTKVNLEALTKEISTAIADFQNKKEIRDERKKGFEVLESIPGQDTEDWQSFVEAAKKYESQIHEHEFDAKNKCIYCHQDLNSNALQIVQTYTNYLNDQSQSDFKIAEEKLNKLNEKLNLLEISYNLSEDIQNLLAKVFSNGGKNTLEVIQEITASFAAQKTNLLNSVKTIEGVVAEYQVELSNTASSLSDLSQKRQETLESLQKSDADKKLKLMDLDKSINELEDHQSIVKWKDKINGYFAVHIQVRKYQNANKKITTRGITELGAKAHDELLTDSVRQSFESQLKALGKDIEVTLEKTSAGKGKVRSRLKILGKGVTEVLSEGEQKAVGLALFLAEIENQQNSCPIIFDDPVTSLDHEVADVLAKRLLEISLKHQLVIFTHNKLFYDSLVYWCSNFKDASGAKILHVCKNYTPKGCSATGCHVYTYRVDRESKEKTGRVFEAQIECLNYYIEKAEKELEQQYTISTVAGYLKSAIEYFIDEKVLNNQSLIRNHKVKDHIEWDRLKEIKVEEAVIDQLHEYWEDLSNRGTHLSANSNENPLKTEDFIGIINYLKVTK